MPAPRHLPHFIKFQRKIRFRRRASKITYSGGQIYSSRLPAVILVPSKDRKTEGGIRKHMASTIETLKKVRSLALDADIKIAVENHAGDMHSRELVELIEKAGPEFVGATIDTGNATWTLEDPVETFRILADHAVCSGIRDSMVWRSKKVPKFNGPQWGWMCGYESFVQRMVEKVPRNSGTNRNYFRLCQRISFLDKEFWPPYSSFSSG